MRIGPARRSATACLITRLLHDAAAGMVKPTAPVEEDLGISPASLRASAVAALLAERQAHTLSSGQVQGCAWALGKSERTVWRWLKEAESEGRLDRKPRQRFEITEDIEVLLAYHRGNVKRTHEELAADAVARGEKPVSLSAVRRAVRRDLTPAQRAALRLGLPAAETCNPRFQRPAVHRNEVWEGDHKQVPADIALPNRRLVRPWLTWFIDRGSGRVMGYAVTPVSAHRGSVLSAMHSSMRRDGKFGPAGGRPDLVRIDRGADFLSKTATAAFALLGIPVHVVKRAHLKGGVERMNLTVTTRFFADLPRYTKSQQLDHRSRSGDADPPLTLNGFITLLDQWIRDYNSSHINSRTGMTPDQAWESDPAPVRDVPARALHQFMLESDRKGHRVTAKGIQLGNRYYMGSCITGRIGDRVRVFWLPHHHDEIEVYEYDGDGRYLGTCELSDRASPDTIREVRRARADQEARARRVLNQAAKERRTRFAPMTQPDQEAKELTKVLTVHQAKTALNKSTPPAPSPRRSSTPYIPAHPAAPDWVLPGTPTPAEDTDA
ncbi:Mu transposase C-terminal domain-containing protein [Streptomyces parvus]